VIGDILRAACYFFCLASNQAFKGFSWNHLESKTSSMLSFGIEVDHLLIWEMKQGDDRQRGPRLQSESLDVPAGFKHP